MREKIESEIENFSKKFLKEIKNQKIYLVSHYDTDGITSAAILSKTLERLAVQFSTKIIKQLDDKEILSFPEERVIVLLDLGAGNLESLSKIKNKIIIIDHHEINKFYSKNIIALNPHLINSENFCSAELCYLISKEILGKDEELARLAILGMVGDTLEKEINKIRNQILKDAEVVVKKGVLIYPSTRPLDKALEYSSRPFIPGVTGDSKGTYELLSEAGIKKIGKSYKTLLDLSDKEMKNLATAIMLRLSSKESSEYVGNLYIMKLFNKIEDAREISAIINACSRMGRPEIALLLCLGNNEARKKAERLYVRYRQHIITGLKYINEKNLIKGKHYVIINAKDKVKDTIIGTLASILSFSSLYKEGTIIIAMAYNGDKIKVSTRMVGRNIKTKRNLKELMDSITCTLGRGISGGHKQAAGCIIRIEDEEKFIELVKRKLEVDVVRIK